MKATFLDTAQVRQQLRRLMKEYDEYFWAVAWGSDGDMADRLLVDPDKIRQLLVGTHFCQTDPALLERLKKCKGARVVAQSGGGTFHPKVFVFAKGSTRAAIIGSANFTNAAFAKNTEAALLLEGSSSDVPLVEAAAFVNAHWLEWEAKGKITDEFLAAYRRQYEATELLRRRLGKPPHIPDRRNGRNPEHDLLKMDWVEFQKSVHTAGNASTISDRLDILSGARRMLDRRSFSQLEPIERRALAGMVDQGQSIKNGLGHLDWKLFGSMLGAGAFQNRINENDPDICSALDHIPPQGEVTKEHFARYCDSFLRAFSGAERQPRLPSLTRLLALKRPDYFVCLDKRNWKGLGKDIGFPFVNLQIDQYWESVLEPLFETKWWNSPRPAGQSGPLWDGRVAMLDVIYYDD